ncbi:hypothetical protein ACVWWO_006912 [Bradyrhizobium sp. F1.13.1]
MSGAPFARLRAASLSRRARTYRITGRPVAAANARTMWNRDTPDIAAISSSVIGSARWLSTYQSARWAGFMAFLSFEARP